MGRAQVARRGFNLIGLVVLVLIIAGVGFAISMLARQAGRTGHWFYHAQLAHDLADAALKHTASMLAQANSRERAKAAPLNADRLLEAFETMSRGSAGSVRMLGSSDGGLPPTLARQLAMLPEFSPAVTVTLSVHGSKPLWTGLLAGVPATPEERQGTLLLQAHASVKAPSGIRVERTIQLERTYKLINPTAPILGRFSLFAAAPGAGDPNTVAMTFDPATGNATPGGVRPIVLESKAAAPIVAPGTNRLDRAAFANALTEPKFLDTQGWVYLGGANPWKLRLAHGFGEAGESPLLPGQRTQVEFRGSKADDEAFRKRVSDGFRAGNASCLAYLEKEQQPETGLWTYTHGFAENYGVIGLEKSMQASVAGKMNFGPGTTSSLRLFGDATRLSPTLVFGPAMRTTMRRAAIRALMGPRAYCPRPGIFLMPLFKLGDHVAAFSKAISSAFGGQAEFDRFGTNLRDDEPFVQGLNVALSTAGSGTYAPSGLLFGADPGAAPAAPARQFSSDLLPWLGTLPQPNGIPQAALQKLVSGSLESDRVFRGNLNTGLSAFSAVVARKLTFTVTPDAFARRILVGGELKLPGIVLIDKPEPLTLPAVTRVIQGGVLINRGPVTIRGNIVHGEGDEPLTIVSLDGDVTVEGGVQQVDALLVSLKKQVRLTATNLTVNGGVAGQSIDLDVVRTAPGARTIKHSALMDPVGPKAASVRAYFGGEDKIVVSGGGL